MTDDLIGSGYSWEGDVIGSGKMTLNGFVENESVESTLEFFQPPMDPSNVYWKLEPVENGTKATWTNIGPIAYPVGRYVTLMMDSMLGPAFENGLNNLKAFCEKVEAETME